MASTRRKTPVRRILSRRSKRQPDTGAGFILRFVLALVALSLVCISGLVVIVSFENLTNPDGAEIVGTPAPTLNPIERAWLQFYLRRNAAALLIPAQPDNTAAVQFTVAPGESAGVVAQNLQDDGLIRNAELLQAYLQWRGWDGQIEAGTVVLSPSFTLPEIATALTSALPNQVAVTIWPGWRLEQIAESLSAHPYLAVDQTEFLQLARREIPLPGDYALLAEIPAGQSLEGFFLPGTYNLAPLATASDVADTLLRAFDAQALPALQLGAANRNLTPYQVVILASILEREAVHDDEFPTIASVYLNRLAIDMRLEADPTTQYGLAAPGDWWPALNFSPRNLDHPYNTYVIFGLPPGPIANPSQPALLGVLLPAETDFFFFRAACDGSGYHNFSQTYEQHLANGCN